MELIILPVVTTIVLILRILVSYKKLNGISIGGP